MIDFVISNLATIIISALILTVVVLISANLINSKKKGKAVGCGCGCAGCPSASLCGKQ